jgi:hypothetical protein
MLQQTKEKNALYSSCRRTHSTIPRRQHQAMNFFNIIRCYPSSVFFTKNTSSGISYVNTATGIEIVCSLRTACQRLPFFTKICPRMHSTSLELALLSLHRRVDFAPEIGGARPTACANASQLLLNRRAETGPRLPVSRLLLIRANTVAAALPGSGERTAINGSRAVVCKSNHSDHTIVRPS